MALKTVSLPLGPNSYHITIGPSIITAEHVKPYIKGNKAFIITDEHVEPLHSHLLQKALNQLNIEHHVIALKPGEASKSFDTLLTLLDQIGEHIPNRKTTLIALGGGVVGDITGFAASILLRGVAFIQVPTTLLAAVDSSVGGKTGINNRFGKNLIGSFYQPKTVLIDTNTLTTLPIRELKAGYAEIVKYALIDNKPFFHWLEENQNAILNLEEAPLTQAIQTCCQMKADIVARDEKESGMRMLLNLGHSFGHALEQHAGYDGTLLHGEAVSIGMCMAFALSEELGQIDPGTTQQLIRHLEKAGLPTHYAGNITAKECLEIMKHDKKNTDHSYTLILPTELGKAVVQTCHDTRKMEDAIGKFING